VIHVTQKTKLNLNITFKTILEFFCIFILVSCVSHQYQLKIQHGPLAVWDIENLSPTGEMQTNLGEFLSSGIIQFLSDERGMDIIERQRLVQLLEELNIGSSEIVSQDTKLRLGRLAGARLMIFGGYQRIGSKIRFDLRLVDVETGTVVNTATRTIASQSPDQWLRVVKQLASELVKNYR